MTSGPRRITVVGPGAVGSALGGFLALAGHRVTFVGRGGEPAAGSHLDEVGKRGLLIDGIKGRHEARPAVAPRIPTGADAPDLILLTVKSFDTARAAESIAESTADCPVLHLQNGVGNYEIIREILPDERIVSGMIIIGFTIRQPGAVRVTVYGGDISIGRMDGHTSPAVADCLKIFADLPFAAHGVENIQSHLWAKLLYNCALNPLGAIFDVPYGALQSEAAQAVIREILAEAFQTAEAHGIALFWPDSEGYRAFLTGTQIPATADHFPSMGADLKQGKRTEIDFLNGAVVRLAAERGLSAPVNETLVRQIRFLEGVGRA